MSGFQIPLVMLFKNICRLDWPRIQFKGVWVLSGCTCMCIRTGFSAIFKMGNKFYYVMDNVVVQN